MRAVFILSEAPGSQCKCSAVASEEMGESIWRTLEKKIDSFAYSAIEWRALNFLNLDKEQSKKMLEILNTLEELDDVQNVFTNANLEN